MTYYTDTCDGRFVMCDSLAEARDKAKAKVLDVAPHAKFKR